MKNSKELHREFVALAFDIIKMKNKLMGLLLEIYEKEIYREQNCRTIYEYGFRYARLSKEVIDKALRTLKHLEDKPSLKKVVETQGIHKVAMVATIATPENEKVLARHVENMSKAALFEFSKELRRGHDKCKAVRPRIKLELDGETQEMFLNLKEQYANDCSNGEALKIMLKKLVDGSRVEDGQKVQDKAVNGGAYLTQDKNDVPLISVSGNEAATETSTELQKFPSRHIPAQYKRKILKKYKHKCAYPNCLNPPQQLHHRVPFAFRRSHDTVIPLCKVHHEFAHNGIIKHELSEPENWKIVTNPNKSIYDGLKSLYIK